jgi:hypothetical protein
MFNELETPGAEHAQAEVTDFEVSPVSAQIAAEPAAPAPVEINEPAPVETAAV